MADWRDELHFIWSDYLARADGDGDRAEMLLRRDLEGTRGGREVLDAYDRGDLEAASAALIPILEAR